MTVKAITIIKNTTAQPAPAIAPLDRTDSSSLECTIC